MPDYAFIFPVTRGYEAEGRALVKSLSTWMPDTAIYATTIGDLPDDVFDDIAVVNVMLAPECDTSFRRIRTFRFELARQLAGQYKVVGLLDADMVLIRPIDNIFRMAEAGTLLVCSDNTMLRFQQHHFDEFGIDVPDGFSKVHATFSTVPTFFNPSMFDDYLERIWTNQSGNDLRCPNLIAAAMGLSARMYWLSSYSWTNIHHTMLKPETFIKQTDDGLYSHQGEPVYMLHGHWQDEAYVSGLMEPMEKNYGYHEKYLQCARDCIKTIQREYDKYVC